MTIKGSRQVAEEHKKAGLSLDLNFILIGFKPSATIYIDLYNKSTS